MTSIEPIGEGDRGGGDRNSGFSSSLRLRVRPALPIVGQEGCGAVYQRGDGLLRQGSRDYRSPKQVASTDSEPAGTCGHGSPVPFVAPFRVRIDRSFGSGAVAGRVFTDYWRGTVAVV